MLTWFQEPSKSLEFVLQQTDAVTASDYIAYFVIGIFTVGIFLKLLGASQRFTNYIPALLTSIGIFGTFIGITLGLLDFDHKNIDESIEYLLAGMKTAFITSLIGMFFAIIFKIFDSFFIKKIKITLNEEVTPKHILESIQEQNATLNKLITTISGDNERTLINQIRLLRSDNNDNYKNQLNIFTEFSNELWLKINNFSEMLSKSATEQVINALKEVITDFNKNLTDQFGENFKQLNQAVEKLVTWQEQYKQQLTDMVEQYKQGVTAITQTEASITNISTESKSIPVAMESLKAIMVINQHQIQELNRHLSAFKEIRDKAVEAVPEIRNQIDMTVKTIQSSVDSATKHYNTLLTESDIYIKKHQNTQTKLLDNFTTAANNNIKTIVDGSGKIRDKLNASAIEVSRVITDGANDFQNSVYRTNESLTTTSDHLQKQTETIKQHLQDAITDLNKHLRDMLLNLITEAKTMSSTLKTANNDLLIDTRKSRDESLKSIDDVLNTLKSKTEQQLNQIYQAQTAEIKRTFNTLEDDIKNRVKISSDSTNEHLKFIDNAMQKEVQRVMETMGRALTAISGKFVDDYTKILSKINPSNYK